MKINILYIVYIYIYIIIYITISISLYSIHFSVVFPHLRIWDYSQQDTPKYPFSQCLFLLDSIPGISPALGFEA